MIPDYSLPDQFTPAPFQSPFEGRRDPRHDRARGGIALNDAGSGLDIQEWRAELRSDRRVGLRAQITSYASETLFNGGYVFPEDANHISLAFDNNMQPMVAYEAGGQSHLRWFDVNVSAYVTLSVLARDGIVRTDDPRPIALSVRDCIFSYVRNDVLCCRIFRDRFRVEYPLHPVSPLQRMYQAGMNINLQFQWEFVWDTDQFRGCGTWRN